MSSSRHLRRKARPSTEAPTPAHRTPPPARAVRVLVAHTLEAVYAGQSLSQRLGPQLAGLAPAERGFAQALIYATLRQTASGHALLARLLDKPLARGASRLTALLLAALTELRGFATPAYAAVDAAVEAVRLLGQPGASGLVNAVLRRFLREREALLAEVAADADVSSEHPAWLLKRIRVAWPAQAEAILAANRSQGPMWLRVAPAAQAGYLARLEAAGLRAVAGPLPGAVCLEQPVDAQALPGFAAGEISVQDLAAQVCAHVLAPRAGERILDACAAPGGKTAHLLERAPQASVLAVDHDRGRLIKVEDTLRRLRLEAELRCADVGAVKQWWDGERFDAILLDAPCSSTGVIRRHPDILWLRRDSDIAGLVATQRRLLQALWPLLKPGGRLLYATCSVLPEENQQVVSAFLSSHRDAVELDLPSLPTGLFAHSQRAGRTHLPGELQADGFYLALLGKRPG